MANSVESEHSRLEGPSVFVSYARQDQAMAAAIAEALESLGHRVWWDRDLLPAQDFRAAILEQLDAADAVVVLWSRESVLSQWVIDEAERAVDQRKLIPIGCPNLSTGEIPLGLNRQNLIFLERESSGAFNRVARQVTESIALIRGEASRPHRRRKSQRSARWKLYSGVACVAAVVGFAAHFATSPLELACIGSQAATVLYPDGDVGTADRQNTVASATFKNRNEIQFLGVAGEGVLSNALKRCEMGVLAPGYASDCAIVRVGGTLSIDIEEVELGNGLMSRITARVSTTGGSFDASDSMQAATGGGSILVRESGVCQVRRKLLGGLIRV